jgi:exopolyphosphatase / guanosine-5'-triphosphate,3'-diphosphate pyrophosphatase
VVIDVGGGSTEVIVAEAGVVTRAVSVDVGCVRLTERWLGEEPVGPALLRCVRRRLDALLAERISPPPPGPLLGIAVAGTATTLAAFDLGLAAYDPSRVHRHVLRSSVIEAWIERLAPRTPAERCRLGCIEPGRAGVIVAGALVLASAAARLGLDAVEVSERDILHGVALSVAGG